MVVYGLFRKYGTQTFHYTQEEANTKKSISVECYPNKLS